MSKQVIVFYDNWCPNCTRFINTVKKIDWLHGIREVPLRTPGLSSQYPGLDLQKAYKEMASYQGNWHYGFISIYLILIRLPLAWVFIPILFLLKILGIGEIIYKELAIKRKIIPIHCTDDSCQIPEH